MWREPWIGNIGEEQEVEYFWGSVKLMLIVYGLAAFIAMLVAWIIKLIFAGIRRQRVAAEAKIDAGAGKAA